ncbi:anaerobic magnesium-protoporphyrin IX monomethyl ester cyclase [Bacilli bacterium PM5-9]|nr:anaerobic magnesium-protoporphyrin IX monomethyl ester cyclase [Bacilli bacterium PM5-9]
MKIVLTTLNSKYIHPSPALRIISNDLKNSNINHDLIEYTIKEDIDLIIEKLKDFDVVAFSCYIYNIEKTKDIIKKLKEIKPNIIIILGGPEVSFSKKSDLIDIDFDYIVCGEGEKVFVELIKGLIENNEISNEYIIIKKDNDIILNKGINYVDIDYAMPLTNDLKGLDFQNQIIYFETSRGCPYQCTYCQASLDNNVRNFPLEYIFKKIDEIFFNKVKIVKLLDRTFNFDTKRTNEILNYIIENDNKYTTFQFEITGELLDISSIDLINKKARSNQFRFEIGIQSTNIQANKAVLRYQDFAKLEKVIKKLQENNKIVLHLDLIAGLPNEDLASFKKTFNQVFALNAQELQLGFLKILKGTNLNNDIDKYGYVFDEKAPYQIIESDFLTKSDISEIEKVEHALEHLYNHKKAKELVVHLLKKYEIDAFSLFNEIGNKLNNLNQQIFDIYQVIINSSLLKDDEDWVVLYKNYYDYHKQRPKSLSIVTNKKMILHKLIEKEQLTQNEVFASSSIELINKDKYFVYLINKRKYYLI